MKEAPSPREIKRSTQVEEREHRRTEFDSRSTATIKNKGKGGFRNNPFHKPPALSNPQDNEANADEMGMSMAKAAQHFNLAPKPDGPSGSDFTDLVVGANYSDNRASEFISGPSAESKVSNDPTMLVSFKPAQFNDNYQRGAELDMSFGGPRVMVDKTSDAGSTIIKSIDETRDDTKEGPAEFMYTSANTDKVNDEE